MNGERREEIAAMKALVDRFEWTSLQTLRSFIDDLDSRAARIRSIDPQWDRDFRQPWLALEEVYAVMIDRGLSLPDAAFSAIVSTAIDKLRRLLSVSD